MNILFICTGNTCRSPMAAALAEAKIKAEGLPWHVLSAGLMAAEGSPASAAAITAVQGAGDLRTHRARQISELLVEAADIIIAMTEGHKQILVTYFPKYKEKIFTFKELSGLQGDVADPFGGDLAVYKACASELESLLESSWPILLKRAQEVDSKAKSE